MRLRNDKRRPSLKFDVMDVRNMSPYTDGQFDLILDKGTLDCLTTGDNTEMDVNSMLDECYRVLKTNGHYILISFGEPYKRLSYL